MTHNPKPEKEDQRQAEMIDEGILRHRDPLSAEEFDFAQYKKAVLADPQARKVIEDFLQHRHREWEKKPIAAPHPSNERK